MNAAASPSFACPWCGAVIDGSEPGSTFACPYCRAKVTAPYAGAAPEVTGGDGGAGAKIHLGPGVQIHGNVQVSASGGLIISRKRESGELFNRAPGYVGLAWDARIGFAGFGGYAPEGEPPRLRAVDLVHGRVAWEALSGQAWTEDLDSEKVAVRGPNVYVAGKRALVALDFMTGAQKWGAQLTDDLEDEDDVGPNRGPLVFDPFPLEGRGAILVVTVDEQIAAFDRDTGHPLWSRRLEHKLRSVTAIPGSNLVAAICDGSLWLMNPAYEQPVAILGREKSKLSFDSIGLDSGLIVAKARRYDDDDSDEGVALVDPASARVLLFEKMEDLGGHSDSWGDVLPVLGHQRVYAPRDNGRLLHVAPGARAVPPPIAGHEVSALRVGGPTLFAMLVKAQGTSVRRLLGLDPVTLAVRFDLGELGTEPDDNQHKQLQTDGYHMVYVASPKDDSDECELRACDTTSGRFLWKRDIGEWQGHYFLGGYLVYVSRRELGVLRPDNGQAIATYPKR